MRNLGRFPAIELALLVVLIGPEAGSARQASTPAQNGLQTGTIVVLGNDGGLQLVHAPVSIRVHSEAIRVDLNVTVGNLTVASFDDLPAEQYLVEIAVSGFEPAQIIVPVQSEQVAKVSVEVIPGASPSILLRLADAPSEQPPHQVRTAEPLLSNADTNPPKGEEESACPLMELMQNTSKRLEEFVENVNRISAIEVLEHERLDKHGKVVEREKHKSNYVAIIEETSPGALNVNEYRDGGGGRGSGFPRDIATLGLPLLAMIFHPSHLDEFALRCEGAGVWRDQPVWRVHFQQRKDRPARISDFQLGDRIVPVLLKGTAWIDAQNYQIVHLESQLLEPIPQVKLYTENQSLDYGPVQFQNSKVSMWLPQAAEINLESGGRHFHHRHIYSDYRIFSVEVGQKIGKPK
jgi:hypothetical protein